MTKKEVLFRVDNDSEMLEVYINDDCVMSGNFWDFNFVTDVSSLLDKLGITNYEEEYSYGEEE